MGRGDNYKCKCCGNHFSVLYGVGMLYSHVCEEFLKDVKKGKYGEELKDLAISRKDLAVGGQMDVFICESCNTWKNDYALGFYVPVDGVNVDVKPKNLIDVEMPVVWPYLLEEGYYKLLKGLTYKCPDCNKDMRLLAKDESYNFSCPRCKVKDCIDFEHMGFRKWD